MRIDRLELKNFKMFESYELNLDPQFNLLVGENGSGKTSILDALTIALAIWLVDVPDPELHNSRRSINKEEVRLVERKAGDRVSYSPCYPVQVAAEGLIQGIGCNWMRQIPPNGKQTSNLNAKEALKIVKAAYTLDSFDRLVFPVIAYYGAGRAWLPSNERTSNASDKSKSARWSAFYDCFSERIHFARLTDWFRREAMAALQCGGYRPGFQVVQYAIVQCVPKASEIWFDADRQEIVLRIDGQSHPLSHLSAGQKMMLALVADLAMRMVEQNSFLVEKTSGTSSPQVLLQTPGVVLIDELDVHLHPLWQRHIVEDLTRTFPAIQFITTTHSPFIIQAVPVHQLHRLGSDPVLLESDSPTLEDVAELVQGVEQPQSSIRADRLRLATEHYYSLLRDPVHNQEQLHEAELEFREASIGFSSQPGLEAILKVEAFLSQGDRREAG